MKKFKYEPTVSQLDEVLNYSNSPEIASATTEELEEYLFVLRSHFNEIAIGNYRYSPCQRAVQHIEFLLSSKKAVKQWYEKPIGLIGITLFVTIVGGLFVAQYS